MRSMDSLFIPRIIGRLSPVKMVFGLIFAVILKESTQTTKFALFSRIKKRSASFTAAASGIPQQHQVLT